MSWDNSVSIATGYGLDKQMIGVQFPVGDGNFIRDELPVLKYLVIINILLNIFLKLKLLFKSWKDIHYQMLIKVWQNRPKEKVINYILRSTDFLTPFGVKKELPQQQKESVIIPIYKRCDITDCSNYRGISLLVTPSRTSLIILLSRLIQYVGPNY
jgi:hypothetical protein